MYTNLQYLHKARLRRLLATFLPVLDCEFFRSSATSIGELLSPSSSSRSFTFLNSALLRQPCTEVILEIFEAGRFATSPCAMKGAFQSTLPWRPPSEVGPSRDSQASSGHLNTLTTAQIEKCIPEIAKRHASNGPPDSSSAP